MQSASDPAGAAARGDSGAASLPAHRRQPDPIPSGSAANVSLEVDPTGVAVLTFDRPGSSANVFDRRTLEELDAHLETIEHRNRVVAVILQSAKPRIFIAGADLNTLASVVPERLGDIVDLGHRVFTRLERLRIPSVAAINGVCLGGGCEIALACDWRVASSDRAVKIGLPETQLGILPAWGGSVRLPRLIGLPAALGIILAGKQVAAVPALKLRLVDEVTHPQYLERAARSLAERGKRRPPDRRWSSRFPLSSIVAARARRQVLAKTRGHYPAPLAALRVATESIGGSLENGFARERAAFLKLAQTPESRHLIGLFFLQERARKLRIAGADGAGRNVNRVAVVGAGVMGSGIAQWVSGRGMHVLLKDVSAQALAKGMHTAEKLYRDAVKRRAFTEVEARAGLDRIVPVAEDVPMNRFDLVIEAAVENLEAKRRIFRAIEACSARDTILATNTSALSIDSLAEGLGNPGRVVGIHFFNPVHRMQLVEIVRGSRTSPEALDTAVRFVKSIGKLPVIARDSPGFLVNRILLPYMVEAVRLFREIGDVARIDRLMLDFGMPMGPLRLGDEVGLDVAQHVAADLQARLPKPVPVDDTLEKMVARGWLGRKSGRGFYEFGTGRRGRERVNPQLDFGRSATGAGPEDAQVLDRLVLVMVNEAARCLEEQVAAAPEDVDFGMIFGTGWAPFRGGPLRYADAVGLGVIVARLDELAREVAPYFGPCERLREMARVGARFYPHDAVSVSDRQSP